MKRKIVIAAIIAAAVVTPATARHVTDLSAKRHHHHNAIDASGNVADGIVRSRKTGATAHVSARYAPQFQAYIDDLENVGASVYFMGGIRRGHCWSGSLHPCGKALDVCQLSRGRVDGRCHLPNRSQIAVIAERHGLFEGGQWCNSDYGHAQVGVTAGACGTTLMARSHHRRHDSQITVARAVVANDYMDRAGAQH